MRVLCVLVLTVSVTSLIWAEGSKDFVTYPGYRMFLDTRDSQQLKVYAGAGEYINVGSSHIGIQGGFIRVFRPNGTLAATYDNTGASTGIGIINNNVQEMAGPTGGGTTNGTGYIPGVIQVPAGQEGIWTVVFDYPSYVNNSFLNILNNAPWTRGANQPNSRRVVLAWDITVTIGGAGNTGGAQQEGRVYTNEHITLINGNGFATSPEFFVLTDDGYLYKVKIDNADPFRFPISSNSLGLVNGAGVPQYKSKPESAFERSDDPSSWIANNFYLFEPQAEDDANRGLINNKIFFNLPDGNMPALAMVTDIFRTNTHTTWLYKAAQDQGINNFFVVGANPGAPPCAAGTFQFGKGANFFFNTNTGGSVTIRIDVNNDGDYDDPVDVIISGSIGPGEDFIFWDGFDGTGVQIPVQDSFVLNYDGIVRFGEIHIALTDVENIPLINGVGGVTFERVVPLTPTPLNQFYYDHSQIGGPISGGGTTLPLPTTIPYTYSGNAGNDKYIDQWTFIQAPFSAIDTIKIVIDCVCETETPELVGDTNIEICAGQDLVLSATNTFPGIGDLVYTWSGLPNLNFIDTVGVLETSTAIFPNSTTASTGTFQVVGATEAGCKDTLNYNVIVNATPVALTINGGGPYCAGESVTLQVQTAPGFATLDYAWTGPGVPANMATGTVAGGDVITLVIPSILMGDAGLYSLVLTSLDGCESEPISTTVTVSSTPEIALISGNSGYCLGENVTLTATNTATGFATMLCTWTGPNGFGVTQTVNAADPIVLNLTNITSSFSGIYTLVCSVASCESDPVQFNLVINTPPLITAISPNGTFCEGTSVTFTAQNGQLGSGPVSYTWTGPNASLPFTGPASLTGPYEFTIPNLSPADAGTYTLTLGGCPSAPQSVNINVLPAPNITITGGGDKCVGQDVTLTATNSTQGVGPIIYIWTDPNGNILSQGVTSDNVPCTVTINNVTAANSGVYTIFKTIDATGCTATETVTINVLPGLNIIDPTPDSTYCEFEDVLLTATNTVDAGDLTYTWTGPNGTVLGPFTVGSFDPLTAIINDATLIHSGTWTLSITSSTGCSSNDIQVEVTILPGVRITAVTGGGQYCLNAPVNLNGSGEGSADSVSYTWTAPNGTIIGSGTTVPAGPFPGSSNQNLPGTYILEVIADSSGCGDSDSVIIEIIPLPEVMVLNNDTTLCDLDTLEICGQALTPNIGTFTYTWTTPTDETIFGTASGNAPFCDVISPMEDYGSGPYILRITANGCTSEADTFNVTLNPNPSVTIISGGGTYCAGDTAFICFTNVNPLVTGFFYTYILPDGTLTSGQTLASDTICIPVTQSGTFCTSIESFDGCVSSLACTTVTFEPSADLSVTANTPVCENETLLLSGTNSLPCSGTITYAWNGPNGFTFVGTAPCGGPFTASVPNPVAGEYCLIAPLSSNCPDTACITVVVNPAPTVVGNLINGGGTYCAGDQVVLTAQVTISDNTPITYTWCQNNVPIPGQTGTVPSGTILTLDLGQLAGNDAGEYCLKLESINGCVNMPETCTQITVNPTPAILTVTGGGTYCEGVNVPLNGTGTPGLGNVTYMWTGPNNFMFNGGPVPSQGPFPATVSNIAQNGAGIYSLIVKLGDCADTANVVVVVNPKPIITIISGNQTACVGSSVVVSFTINPNGASSVNWSYDSPAFDTSGTVTTLTTITFTIVANATTSATITASSSDGCEAEPQQITITVQDIPTPVLTASSLVLCPGDQLTLTTTPYSGANR